VVPALIHVASHINRHVISYQSEHLPLALYLFIVYKNHCKAKQAKPADLYSRQEQGYFPTIKHFKQEPFPSSTTHTSPQARGYCYYSQPHP
jgi:hypothetical protein